MGNYENFPTLQNVTLTYKDHDRLDVGKITFLSRILNVFCCVNILVVTQCQAAVLFLMIVVLVTVKHFAIIRLKKVDGEMYRGKKKTPRRPTPGILSRH